MARSLDDAASKGVAGAGLGLGIAGTALGLWALVKNGGNLLGGIGGGETIIANNTLGYGAAGVSGFGYTPSEVYMSAKQCEDNVALTRAIYDTRIKDLQEKTGIYNYFNDKFCQVEKQIAALEQAKPYEQKILELQFQLAQNHSDRYTDKKTCGVIYGVNVLPETPVVTGYEGANGPWGSCGCPRVAASSSTPAA